MSCDMTRLRGQDLNLRPLGYEPSELPNCSTPRYSFKVTTANFGQLPIGQVRATDGAV